MAGMKVHYNMSKTCSKLCLVITIGWVCCECRASELNILNKAAPENLMIRGAVRVT